VGVVAAAPELAFAEEALAAADGEGDDDAVADFDFALIDVGADFFDDAHRLVTEDVAGLHEGDETVDEVEIGAADTCGGEADDRVAAVEDFGIGDVFYLHLIWGAPDCCFHGWG